MTSPVRAVLATGAALSLAAAVAALSRVPYAVTPDARAALRLSWRARGERIERCRRPSESEQQALPAHMRQDEICEGGAAPYRLSVVVDDTVRVDATVRGAGARHDRPIYVYREIPLPPGLHRVRVAFAMADSASAAPREGGDAHHPDEGADPTGAGSPHDAREDDEHRALDAARRIQHAGAEELVPRRLAFEDTVRLAPRAVALVTYLPEQRRLALLAREEGAPPP